MEAPISSRRLVFISHANPEENDFVLWLGVQLASAGYEVWSDVTKLIGGEVFWDDIEDAIRHHSAKFIFVVSGAALKKDGVKDEVAVAVSVERKDKVDKFVVPIRVDDVPFSDFTANITRKNAIDFSKGWSDGLAKLFDVLNRDQVPKGAVKAADVKAWCDKRFDPAKLPRNEPEDLISNWLPITSLPQEVSLFSLGVEEKLVRGIMDSTSLPWFLYFRLVGTFGIEADLRHDLAPDQLIQLQHRIVTERFLAGRAPETPGVTRGDARKFVVNLLRQGWNNLMQERGLLPFEMGSGSIAWYFPKDLVKDDKVYFLDRAGKRRHKSIVGRSEKRGVYWHLGVAAKPVLGNQPHFVIKTVVLFSEDGKKPLDSVDKMVRLRRGFCRNWWNPTWRNLTLAFVSWLADNSESIDLPFGDFARATLSAATVEFTSEVTCADPAVKSRTPVTMEGEALVPDTHAEVDEEDVPPELPVEDDDEYGNDDSLGSEDYQDE